MNRFVLPIALFAAMGALLAVPLTRPPRQRPATRASARSRLRSSKRRCSPWCKSSAVLRLLALLLLALATAAAPAKEAAPAAQDPVLEKRVMALAEELRCLVCQNQTLADSNAPLAEDLRSQIRERMREGNSDAQVVEYLVARYGDFVLYRPPLKATTVLLWFGPLLLLAAGFAVLLGRLLRRRSMAVTEMTAADRKRAAELLAGTPGERR